MIHSARPIVTPVANIVFCSFVFLDFKSGDGRTTCVKTIIPTGRGCGLAEWIIDDTCLDNAYIYQVTTLVSSKSPQKKKGKSKRAHVLVAAVERATGNFVERGKLIAQENPDIEPEMLSAVEEVKKTGEVMSSAARDFASDPCSSAKRGNMVRHKNIQGNPCLYTLIIDMHYQDKCHQWSTRPDP